MFKAYIKKLSILFILIVFSQVAYVQTTDRMVIVELKQAILAFENEQYELAYPFFEKMLNQYPKEPLYNYYVGICSFYLFPEPEKSLDVLRYAATQNVPNDVYFYLAICYHRNYQFEYAIHFFERFERVATTKQKKEYDLVNVKSRSQNALFYFNSVDQPHVNKSQEISNKELLSQLNDIEMDGHFVRNPEFLSRYIDKSDDVFVFLPNDIEWGEVIYFSMHNRRGNKDIFRITKVNDTLWAKPENLGKVINTDFDEDFPFIHFDGATLYFTSKGHFSMGDYDLHKSTWDWETQTWSMPENMGFPLNSTYNDFLYILETDLKLAYLVSDRNCTNENVNIYTLRNTTYRHFENLRDNELAMGIASLPVNVIQEQAEKDPLETKSQQNVHQVKLSNDFKHREEYDSLLNVAVTNQMKADSLRWVMEEERTKYEQAQSKQVREKIVANIVKLEGEVYQLQKKTDRAYEMVRQIEQLNLVDNRNLYTTTNKEEQEVDYQNASKEETLTMKEPLINNEVEPITDQVRLVNTDSGGNVVIVENTDLVEFELKDKPFYSTQKPVPLNEPLPDGIVYKVRLGVFSKQVNTAVFKGMYPISAEKKTGSNLTKYYAGLFYWESSAKESLPIIRNQGFRDAFIVAFESGNLIKVSEAVTKERSKNANINYVDIEKESTSLDEEIWFELKVQIPLSDKRTIERFSNYSFGNYNVLITIKDEFKHFNITGFSSFEMALEEKRTIQDEIPYEAEIHAFFSNSKVPVEQLKNINNK